jgi:hypothetical protein
MAVELEDAMKHDEPPDWIQPVRHTLGAALMTAKRPAEAEVVYRGDVVRGPENAWSLLGLARSLHAQGKHDAAHEADARARKAWADADIQVESTCLCLPGR